MKKTSVYLTYDELEGLRRLSTATGRPQAQIVREAVAEYVATHAPPRRFLSAGAGDSGRGGPGSVADENLDDVLSEMFEEDQRREREWGSS